MSRAKSPEAFGRVLKLRHADGRWLMIPARAAQGPAVFTDDISAASCYASTDAFKFLRQLRADGYPVAVTGYTGAILTPYARA